MLGYKASKGDPDVFMKREVQDDGTEYYSYFVIYVDDILCVHEYPKKISWDQYIALRMVVL